MHVTALQGGELAQRKGGGGVGRSRAGQRNENLIGVQPGVLATQIVGFQGLDGLDGGGGDQIDFLINAGQLLQRVEQGRGRRTQQGAGLAGDHGAVRQLDGGSGAPPVFSETAWAACSTGRLPSTSPA